MTTPQLSPPPLDVAAAAGTQIAARTAAAPRGLARRTGRRIARVACARSLAALLAVSAGANAVLTVRDGLAQPYGQLVTLPGGQVNTAVSGTGEETFVIMPGYGSASPVLEFAPLVDDLDDHATVVVVEPFGYGYSDRRTDADRTLENMSTELHQTLTALDVHQPYTLVAHSIGALYALDYVNRFPGEVRAVVSIDGSVPIDAVAAGAASRWLRLWTTSGVTRWVSKVKPDLLVQAPQDTYSERRSATDADAGAAQRLHPRRGRGEQPDGSERRRGEGTLVPCRSPRPDLPRAGHHGHPARVVSRPPGAARGSGALEAHRRRRRPLPAPPPLARDRRGGPRLPRRPGLDGCRREHHHSAIGTAVRVRGWSL